MEVFTMFNFSYPKKDQMEFWFERADSERLNILKDGKVLATMLDTHTDSIVLEMDDYDTDRINTDYRLFCQRPEYVFGMKMDDTDGDDYDRLIVGYFLRKYVDENKAEQLAKRCLEWLHNTDFYTAPASTQYHDSVDGGLVTHSINVYNKMVELIEIESFSCVDKADALITALVHDWCKIGLYERFMRNVKNEDTGAWEKVTAFRHTNTQIPLGHGTTSMFMAGKFFKLSTEQALAIRWHMGVYQVSDPEKPDLFRANERYPMVYLLQFADQLSISHY
jgi:hypothetical protein